MHEAPLNFACQLVLMGTDARTGRHENDAIRLGDGVAAAVLVELACLDRIAVRGGTLVVTDRRRTHDAVLDAALLEIVTRRRPRSVWSWLGPVRSAIWGPTYEALRRAGHLVRDRPLLPELFSGPRHRVNDPTLITALRVRAASSFFGSTVSRTGGRADDVRADLLLSLGCASGLHRVLLPGSPPGAVAEHLGRIQDEDARTGGTHGVLREVLTGVVMNGRATFE